ncbi:MAG: GntR family transcriptional regulator [Acetobacteraceae bacterium]
MGGIVKSTLAEQVYRDLRERIMAGEFAAGHKLLAEDLSRALSVSPTPVKEALAMLAQDGLVDASARKITRIRQFSRRAVHELYDARIMIESQAVRTGFAAGRVTADFLERLASAADSYDREAQHHTGPALKAVQAFDQALHLLIGSLADNDLVAEWHGRILRQVQTARIWSVGNYAFDAARQEHAAIMHSFRAGQEAAVIEALVRHLKRSDNDLSATMPADGEA